MTILVVDWKIIICFCKIELEKLEEVTKFRTLNPNLVLVIIIVRFQISGIPSLTIFGPSTKFRYDKCKILISKFHTSWSNFRLLPFLIVTYKYFLPFTFRRNPPWNSRKPTAFTTGDQLAAYHLASTFGKLLFNHPYYPILH